jgi:hypothetical protein
MYLTKQQINKILIERYYLIDNYYLYNAQIDITRLECICDYLEDKMRVENDIVFIDSEALKYE